eukprot:8579671-Pyramimonas_sp.AAC.1
MGSRGRVGPPPSKEQPKNKQVIATLRTGITVTDLYARTPPDACQYFVTTGNWSNSVTGSSSLME